MAQNTFERKVVVVGGGVAGMGAAILWSSKGFDVTLLERSAELPSPVDRGDVLHVRALSAIRTLGVDLTDLSASANPLDRFEILDHRSQVLFGSTLSALAVRHTALADALWSYAQGLDNLKMLAGVPVNGIVADGDGRIVAAEAGGHQYPGLVVIAAGSSARRLSGMPAGLIEARPYGERFVNLLVQAAHIPARLQHTGLYVLSPRGVVVFVPLPGGLARVGVQMVGDDRPAEGTAFLDEAVRRWPILSDFGLSLEGTRVYRLQRAFARSMYVPGMLILGDAAHTVHPVGGQGIGLAMEDIATLRTALADIPVTFARHSLDSVLGDYSERRCIEVRRRTRPLGVLGRMSSHRVTRTTVARGAIRPLNAHPAIRRRVLEAMGACSVPGSVEDAIALPDTMVTSRPRARAVHIPALDRFGAEILYDYFPEPLSPLDRDLLRSLVEVTLDVGLDLGLHLAPATEVLARTESGATEVRPTAIGLTLRSALLLPVRLSAAAAKLRNRPLDWVEHDLKGSVMPRIERLNAEVACPDKTEEQLLRAVEAACVLRDEVFTSRSPHFLPSFALKLAAPMLSRISPHIARRADDTSSIETPTSWLRADLDALMLALQAETASPESLIEAFVRVHGGRGHTFVPLPSDEVWDVNSDPLSEMLVTQRNSAPRTAPESGTGAGGFWPARVMARRLQEIAAARDWVTFGYEASTRAMRTAILILGDRLVERRLLIEPRDVFLMTLAELRRAVRIGETVPRDALLARRSSLDHEAVRPSGHRAGTPAIKGLAASPGAVEGIAIVVTDDGDLGKLQPGQILVCKMTTPSWLPLLRIAGGVVTDMGGFMSHAAIVARSFGIPAVTATGDATTWVQTGRHYRLDGNAGTITEAASSDG